MTPAGQAASAVDAPELEWQFDALDLRPVLRWLDDHDGRNGAEEFRVAPAGSANQVDLYLDTEDQRFYRAGYALRIRRVNRRRHGEATLKALGGASPMPGLRDRREVAQHLDEVDVEALQRSDGPVGERVRAVAGRKKLLQLFEVRTNRHTFSVSAGGLAPGEVALDETRIQPGDGSSPARLRRVEVEVPATVVHAFEPFVEGLRIACALTPGRAEQVRGGPARRRSPVTATRALRRDADRSRRDDRDAGHERAAPALRSVPGEGARNETRRRRRGAARHARGIPPAARCALAVRRRPRAGDPQPARGAQRGSAASSARSAISTSSSRSSKPGRTRSPNRTASRCSRFGRCSPSSARRPASSC